MQIKYVGKSLRRVVGPYVWEKKNGFLQDVADIEVVTELLTAPTGEFVAIEPEKAEAKMEEFITEPIVAPVKKRKSKKQTSTGG